MVYDFERTSLWRTSLADREEDPQQRHHRERLRVAFFALRNKIDQLVPRISAQLSDLTRHDITHLDALWGIGSLIAGDGYPINGLEGFVLGGAFLLHDSALCFEAYDGGIEAVRNTPAWKDAYAAESAASGFDPDEGREVADFCALRLLHAAQAEQLADRGWSDPTTKQLIYLIDDPSLRKHLGQLIGQIAASHHWSIEEVASRLQQQVNALPDLPSDWRIDPVKLACLLRCADVFHIDSSRAPDFLHALLRRKRISSTHWQAQNWLARVDVDMSDPTRSTLLVSSTRAFPEHSAEAWWIAYDAVIVADRELRESNALLDSRKFNCSPAFAAKRVRGAEGPERMANYIRADGWSPCSAALHVTDVEAIVQALGGRELYVGQPDMLAIAIRELVQNSRDAVQARRSLESDFVGTITIRLTKDHGGTLIIEDNGVGMSQRVLTGPLLGFGTSFWASSLVHAEFPGLRSSRFRSVGRFGVGFFSVFMVAHYVAVASKRWDQGFDKVTQLLFRNGLSLRPLLKPGCPAGFHPSTSTQITLQLNRDVLPTNGRVTVKPNIMGRSPFEVPFADYLSALVAGLDVAVSYIDPEGRADNVHSPQPLEDSARETWLTRVSFSKYRGLPSTGTHLESDVRRLRPIVENGHCYGLAAVATGAHIPDYHGLATVGGLTHNVQHPSGTDYVGFMDFTTESAKRVPSRTPAASKAAIDRWALEQLQLLQGAGLSPDQELAAPYALARFGIDPTPIARVVVIENDRIDLLGFSEVAQLLDRIDVAIFKASYADHAETQHAVTRLPGYALIRPVRLGSFLGLKLANGQPEDPVSMIGCLHRAVLHRGRVPRWKCVKGIAPAFFGGMMDALVLSIEER